MNTRIWTVVTVIAAIVYCLLESGGNGDFYIFISASAWLDGHTDIFSHRFLVDYNYYYSVLFALLLKPFYTLPFFWVKFCWLMFNLYLFYKMFDLLGKSSLLSSIDPGQKKFFLLAVFLFSARFLHQNIHASQITILILWCCVFGLYWIHQGKTVRGSLVLALGINIKLLPLVLLPYLLYRGFYKAFGITTSAWIFSLLAPGFVIGHKYNTDLLECWFILINPANTRHVLDTDERSFHSLTTLLSTLLVEHPPDYYALPLKRNLADLPVETLAKVILAARIILIGFTLWFLKLRPFRPAPSLFASLCEISYILLLVPLIFPHQQHYAFLFIVPAFAFVLFILMQQKKWYGAKQLRLLVVSLVLVYLASNLQLLLGEFTRYYEHYKILTYAALALVPLLVWSRLQIRDGTPAIQEERLTQFDRVK